VRSKGAHVRAAAEADRRVGDRRDAWLDRERPAGRLASGVRLSFEVRQKFEP
jgi:hypothetical protein